MSQLGFGFVKQIPLIPFCNNNAIYQVTCSAATAGSKTRKEVPGSSSRGELAAFFKTYMCDIHLMLQDQLGKLILRGRVNMYSFKC